VLLALLVVLPAAVNPAGAAAFEPLKTSLLRVAAVLVALGWLAHRTSSTARPEPLREPIVRAGLLFAAAAAVSTALSVDPRVSLLGGFDRGMGWLTLVSGVVLLVCGTDLWSHTGRRERAITALLLGAIAPCAYLVVQRMGLDPIPWSTLGAPGSTLGSPTFLAGYLVLLAPLALYRVLAHGTQALSGRWQHIARYVFWLALLLVIGGIVIQSTIRGPLLGLVTGTLAFTVVRGRPGRTALLGATGFLLVTLALAVSATGEAGTRGLVRFLRISAVGDSSVERLVAWRDALGLPMSQPLRFVFGFGPEMQTAALEHAEATVRLTQNAQWDRVHNLILDTWVTGGLLGIVALAMLIAVAVFTVARRRQSPLPAALLGALIGHLVEVSFAFHTVVTGTLFWVILALAASLGVRQSPVSGVRRRKWVIAVGAGIALMPALAAPAIGDAIYGDGQRVQQRGDPRAAALLDETASAWLPWVEEPIRAAGLAWQQVATRQGDATAAAQAEADLIEAARRADWEPTPRLRLLRLYLARDQLEDAEASCQQSLVRGPYRAAVWDACADVSARSGAIPEAQQRRARAETLRQPLP
jgi:O-antigen ligase